MIKPYCTQNNGNCDTCSLVNYGRDCQNVPLKEPTKKLPYDIPIQIAEMLKSDAKKEDIPATQLLIKLIENNHFKEEKKMLKELLGYQLTDEQIEAWLDHCNAYGLELENVINEARHSYLTVNKGRDGNLYFWRIYNDTQWAMNVNNGNFLSDEEIKNILV